MPERERLASYVEKFKSKKVAIVGDVLLDHYLYGDASRTNPEMPGSPLLIVTGEEYRLGGAGNVAANVASLGAEVSLYGIVGINNPASEQIRQLCKQRGIEHHLYTSSDRTIVKQRLIEKAHNNYLARIDFGERSLTPIDEESEGLIETIIRGCSAEAVILSDYNKGVFLGNLGQKIIDLANSKGMISLVDPKPINAQRFKKATVMRPNLKEAKEIVKSDVDEQTLARMLKDFSECRYAVISCGAEGMIIYDGEFNKIPTRAAEVADVTGAGDTVAAVMTLGLISGASLLDSAHIANYAAGIVVGKRGTATTSESELIRKIKE